MQEWVILGELRWGVISGNLEATALQAVTVGKERSSSIEPGTAISSWCSPREGVEVKHSVERCTNFSQKNCIEKEEVSSQQADAKGTQNA